MDRADIRMVQRGKRPAARGKRPTVTLRTQAPEVNCEQLSKSRNH